MRKIIIVLSLLLAVISCNKEESPNLKVTTCPVADVFYNEATDLTEVTFEGQLSGDVAAVTEKGFIWSKGNRFDFIKIPVELDGEFSLRMNDLEKETKFFVKAYALTESGCVYGEQLMFVSSTLAILEPGNLDVSGTTADLSCRLVSNGGSALTEFGAYFNDGSEEAKRIKCENILDGEFTVSVGGLAPSSEYGVSFFAVNSQGEVVIDEIKFNTLAVSQPVVALSADPVVEESPTSFTIKAVLSDDGNDPASIYGVAYGESAGNLSNKVYAEQKDATTGEYVVVIKSLHPSTVYYFAAFAENYAGNVVSTVSSRETMAQTPPNVTTFVPARGTECIDNYIKLKGEITSIGGCPITEYGFYVSEDGQTAKKFVSDNLDEDAMFSVELDASAGIKQNTAYKVKAYAVNELGESSAVEVTVVTGVADTRDGGELYLRDMYMKQTGVRLVYWELAPVDIDVDEDGVNDERLFFLDRNIGATELPVSSALKVESVGNYYLWGSKLPQASYLMAEVPINEGTKIAGWNGWGNQEYWTAEAIPTEEKTWTSLAEIGSAVNPCPEGYRLPTAKEYVAAFKAKNVTDIQGMFQHFNMCATGDFAIGGAYTKDGACHLWTDTGLEAGGSNATANYVLSNSPQATPSVGRKRPKPVRCVRVVSLK